MIPPDPDGLTVASNRLPVRLRRDHSGAWQVAPSVGGLVSAMRPVVEDRRGVWVGWAGACDLPGPHLRQLLATADEAFRLEPVPLASEERTGYYLGFSNRTLWPFLHDLPWFAEPRATDWRTYRRVNARFARALASRGTGPVWVHDYHLMLVGRELRRLGCRRPMGFFLHTPFPDPAVSRGLAERDALVHALSDFDCVGFQTERDRRNFLDTVAALRRITPGWRPAEGHRASLEDRTGAFPISIDGLSWSQRSSAPATARRAAEIRRELTTGTLLLGVDRLDYSKGIPCKLKAYARALGRHPSLRGRVTLRQLAVPSREEIPAYARLGRTVEALVEDVNRRFGTAGWTPVEYIRGRWENDELVAQYRAADAAVVTPLRDGMNLVAKEYCASKASEEGVLVLSRFAGAASQLRKGAILVDPRDEEALAEAIYRAVAMPRAEKRWRMAALRRAVRRDDVHAWARSLLDSLLETAGPRVVPDPRPGRRPGMSRSRRSGPPGRVGPRHPTPPPRGP